MDISGGSLRENHHREDGEHEDGFVLSVPSVVIDVSLHKYVFTCETRNAVAKSKRSFS